MSQSTVRITQGFGNPGDVYTSTPIRVQPFILDSDTADNVVGYAYTVVGEGHATVGGNGKFAGILVNSKAYTNYGTSGNTLGANLNVRKEDVGELMIMGEVVVKVKTTTNDIGNVVYYEDATGELGTAASTAPASHTLIPNAVVSRYSSAAAGLVVIRLTN